MEIEKVVSARGLTAHYDEGTAALFEVDFDLARGEIVGVVGANGAGKSTLMGLLSGEIAPSAGTMTVAGEVYAPDSVEEAQSAGVGYVPQRIELDGERSVAETLFRTSYRSKLSHEEQVEAAQEYITEYGVDFDPEGRVGELVPAEWAILELLRMASEETQVILLDEVSAAFDDHEISMFHALAHRLAAEGRAIVHVSHRIDEVQALSDRIVVLRDGRVHSELIPRHAGQDDIVTDMFGTSVTKKLRPDHAEHGDDFIVLEDVTSGPALRGVSLSVRAGEVLGITGLRRSGISELSEVFAGNRKIESGRMLVDGEPVELDGVGDALAHGIGYIPEYDSERDLDESASVSTSLVGETRDAGMSFAEEARRLQAAIAAVQRLGIRAGSIRREVGMLSGGDQQKVALSRVLSRETRAMVLNQPTRGVDARSREDVYTLIDEVRAEGTAVVLVSSDMSELISRCHRVAILRDGELVDVYANKDLTEDVIMVLALGHNWFEEGETD